MQEPDDAGGSRVPSIAPAVTHALFAATARRLRELTPASVFHPAG